MDGLRRLNLARCDGRLATYCQVAKVSQRRGWGEGNEQISMTQAQEAPRMIML